MPSLIKFKFSFKDSEAYVSFKRGLFQDIPSLSQEYRAHLDVYKTKYLQILQEENNTE